MTLWQLLEWAKFLAALGYSCTDTLQSTHSIPLTEQAITYGGNCLQALDIALVSFGSIVWRIIPS